MAKTTFSTYGITYEFEDNSGEILKAFENARDRALEKIGQMGVDFAQDELRKSKQVYPGVSQDAIDTSALLQSIGYKVVGEEVYIGTNNEAGPYIEFGSGKYSTLGGGTTKESWVYLGEDGEFHMAFPQMARPFLKPAASEHTKEYRAELEDTLKNA